MLAYRKRLLRLGVYFVRRSGSAATFSNFFLLGFRGDYIFLHLSNTTLHIRRLALFLKIARFNKFTPWLLGPSVVNARLIRWVAEITGLPFFMRFSPAFYLFFWRGRYFSLKAKVFNGKLIKLLSIEGVVFIGGASDPRFINQFQLRAVPVIAISHPDETPHGSTYALYTSPKQPGLLIFYVRLLSLFLGARASW